MPADTSAGPRAGVGQPADPGRITGARALAAELAARGVQRVFALSGNQVMPVFDACLDHGIGIVHVRHEAAAVYMADASAQLTGQPAVALVSAGPGFGNALGALYSAGRSGSPVILLCGDAPDGPSGDGAFQTLDQQTAAGPFVKASFRAGAAVTADAALDLAWTAALAAPRGPVHVSLPANRLVERAAAPIASAGGADGSRAAGPAAGGPEGGGPDGRAEPPEVVLAALGARLAGARRPMLLAGAGLGAPCFGAGLGALGRLLDVPVYAMRSPRGLRDPAGGALRDILRACDALVLLEQPVDFSLERLAGVRAPVFLVHADSRAPALADAAGVAPVGLWRTDPVALLAQASGSAPHRSAAAPPAAPVARAGQAPSSEHDARRAWRVQVAAALAHRRTAVPAPGFAAGLAEVARWLAGRPRPFAVFDGGEFGQWAQAVVGGVPSLVNGPSGAIGGGLPHAIAACLDDPARDVVLFSGDGSLGFHLAEFETALRCGARPIVVVGNDAAWNAERQIQLRDYGAVRAVGCLLSREARYDLAAAAMGGFGLRVEGDGSLSAALDDAAASGLAACIDWRIVGHAAPVYEAWSPPGA